MERLIERVPYPPHQTRAWYRGRLAAGEVVALGVFLPGGADVRAVTLYRLEQGDWGQELVILATAGRIPGVDLVATVWPVLESVARACGCGSVRFETARRGLVAKMAARGFRPGPLIMRKVLS